MTYWLVELRPAYTNVPSKGPQYYAGYAEQLDPVVTIDPNRAARFMYKYDADVAAMKLKSPRDFIWKAFEHIFYDDADLAEIHHEDLPSS